MPLVLVRYRKYSVLCEDGHFGTSMFGQAQLLLALKIWNKPSDRERGGSVFLKSSVGLKGVWRKQVT